MLLILKSLIYQDLKDRVAVFVTQMNKSFCFCLCFVFVCFYSYLVYRDHQSGKVIESLKWTF